MKTFCSLSTIHGWIIVLIFIHAIPIYSVAQETSERVVDGIIENIKHRKNLKYYYTTKEINVTYKSLASKSRPMDYNILLPEGTKRLGSSQAIMGYRDYVQNEFFKRTNVQECLAGKRITVDLCSLPDGSVVLRHIYSNESLINTIGSDGIKELISILQSYRFEQYNNQGKYHLGWYVTIFIPKE